MSAPAFAIPSPTGSTRLYAVVGNPIEQVMAPSLMNRLFLDRNVDAVLVPVKAEASGIAAVIEGLKLIGNLGGILVTVPHKFAACGHADHLSERAELAQSANALRREADGSWSADNFDGAGFVAGLLKAGYAVAGKMISLVGAGGAGVSIAAALMLAGTADLSITDVDEQRMAALADRLAQRWPGRIRASSMPIAGDIMINATPIGLQPEDLLPFSVDNLPPRTVVSDIIMKPAETRLLAAARARGLRVHPGLPMLTEQIELYRQFFRVP
ncbi:shikimate dehydrogenase [Aliidongia dinghuensis]|uniref:Shikimate dehydrogenase n=1 Tax=Aliidongia dinghuensis TaxID=1867774 RepID=A0A8J3E736_9PROT|nr:shikimate dehydrogenase [Aliidongia dinghuensis]GGF50819.1 shikimate dehydrogenase [Aliidongia dinghuensis]